MSNEGHEGTRKYQCSFCRKNDTKPSQLVAGPGGVFICHECVVACTQVIGEGELLPIGRDLPNTRRMITPKQIFDLLGDYVIGQDMAKRTLSVALYNHYKRIRKDVAPGVELHKSNVLLLGPTGSGKTLLAHSLARILDVPFTIADATSLTESGYVGEDVENILLRLIHSSDWQIEKAQQGIIYIDEIDKIARKEGINKSITRDVSGEGVQQELLKIIEGCAANVPPQGGRKHPYQEFVQIRTHEILFICGGAFEGLDKIVERRLARDSGKGIGFRGQKTNATLLGPKHYDGTNPLDHLIGSDLLEYGFIPELVGRLPVIASLDCLGEADLVRVLTEPADAVVRQYQYLFSLDGVELIFTPDALKSAAKEAIRRKIGARGLRSIIEDTLLEVMYELPSLEGISRCVIDSDCISGNGQPSLYSLSGASVQLPVQSKRLA